MQGNQIGLFRLMRAPSLIHAWFGAISPFSRKKETNAPMEPGESLVPCILQLPPEIQYLFFGFLNPKELCTASLVCRPWRVVAHYDGFWERLYYRDFGYLFDTLEKPTQAKRALVQTNWGSWKSLYQTTSTETSRSKVYSSFTTHLSCPSLSYCRFWPQWKEYEEKISSRTAFRRYLPATLARSLDPFTFTPSVYNFFQPYHNSNHLSPKMFLNYLRASHCFFFEQYWFWFFFSPSNKSQPSQILFLLSVLFLSLTVTPIFLAIFLASIGALPSGLLCYSFPWEGPQVEWPTPLLLALSHACASPLEIWSTLVLLHSNPYDIERTSQDTFLKASAMLMNVLIVQFVLSSYGITMLGLIGQTLLLFCCIGPCFLELTANPLNYSKLFLSFIPLVTALFFAAELLGVMMGFFCIWALPIWLTLLPQRKWRAVRHDFTAELQSLRWYHTNCSLASIYLMATLPIAYFIIFLYAFVGIEAA